MQDFSVQVEAFIQEAMEALDATAGEIIIELGNSLIRMSPVGNPDDWQRPPPPGYVGGRFRNNWQFSVHTPAIGIINSEDPTGAEASARLVNGVFEFQAGEVGYITNNLPYAIALEFGHSHQAPLGMVRVTVARFQQIVEEAVAKHRV